MNKETEEYIKSAALLNLKPSPDPTKEEITETIANIKKRLEIKEINRFVNAGVKEGYQKSIQVLKSKKTDLSKVDMSDMKTVQGRAIVALAIDYLKGECSSYALLAVPIKDR